jgi:hypothetical protein
VAMKGEKILDRDTMLVQTFGLLAGLIR